MTLAQLLPLIKGDFDIVITELPSAHRFAETVLNKTLDYSWNSINEVNKTTQEFLSSCSNCLGIDPYRIDKSLYMNLEVTGIASYDDIGVLIYVKYENL